MKPVLIIAEAANPEWVSVPLVGWSHAKALASVAPAHVVTHVRNRDAILRAGWTEGEEFTTIDSDAVAAPLYKAGSLLRGGKGKGWTTATAFAAFSYYYFEHLLWKRFGQRIANGEFGLVHRITPLSPTVPSIIARRCRRAGVPFVWGPINGGVPWPKGFDAVRRQEHEWLSYIRGAYKLMPGYGATRRHASAILVGSRATFEQIPTEYRDKCVYVPENAIAPERFSATETPSGEGPLRAAFVGRLVPYKGADMLVEAAAPLVREGKLVIDVIGDGPQRAMLRERVETNGLDEGITFAGWVEHEQLQARLGQAEVFAFPSVREFGGGVVLEAMALGLVPVVVDYAGPGELVTEQTGFRIPIGPRAQIVERLRDTLAQLVEERAALREMGERARRRVLTCFTWQAKARQTLEVYKWVLGERAGKPDFGMPLREDAVPATELQEPTT